MSALTGLSRRTHQKVRARSRKAEEAYGFCVPIDREEKVKRLTAFEAYATRERQRRRLNRGWGPKGPLGLVTEKLGRLFIRFAARIAAAGGRLLAPSREYLANELGVDVRTIDRAKDELRAHGLDWIRRFEPVDEAGGEGPQIRQITNAYRLLLPAAATVLLGFRGLAPPTSADIPSMAEQGRTADLAAKAHSRDVFAARLDASSSVRRALAMGAKERLGWARKTFRPTISRLRDSKEDESGVRLSAD